MLIRSIKHRGLRRFVENDDPRELQAELVARIRNIIAALVVAESMGDVSGPPAWLAATYVEGQHGRHLECFRFRKLAHHVQR